MRELDLSPRCIGRPSASTASCRFLTRSPASEMSPPTYPPYNMSVWPRRCPALRWRSPLDKHDVGGSTRAYSRSEERRSGKEAGVPAPRHRFARFRAPLPSADYVK